MNLFKYFAGPEKTEETVSLPLGEVWLARSSKSPKGTSEKLFPKAELSLISRGEGHTSLVVKPLAEEDDSDPDNSLAALDELESERCCTLRPDLKLAYYQQGGHNIVSWLDPDGDEGDRIEFICNDVVKAEALDQFDRCARMAQYLAKYGKAATSNQQLAEFDFDAELLSSMPEEEETETPEQTISNDLIEEEAAKPEISIESCKPIDEANGTDIYLYDPTNSKLEELSTGATILLLEQSSFAYVLEARNYDTTLFRLELSTDQSQIVFYPDCIAFNCRVNSGEVETVLLKFDDNNTLVRITDHISKLQWQAANKKKLDDLKDSDKAYLEDAFTRMELDTNSEHTSEEASESEDDYEQEEDEDDAANRSASNIAGSKFTYRDTFAGQERNSYLEISNVNDRSYVVRGDKIGVFKTGEDLEYVTTIDNITSSKNLTLAPSKIMLHERDKRLILQGGEDSKVLYGMDLEYGKVVDEWELPGAVNDFGASFKGAKSEPEAKFLAVSKNSLFNLDPRQRESVIAGSKTYSPATKASFKTIATNADGSIVTGSGDGVIRFYNKFGVNAKMALPGMGDPIIGIDSSADGRWVVATCETYLLVIDGRKGPSNLFNQRLSVESKPKPIRLHIDPAAARQMYLESGSGISFTPAKLDFGNDAGENTIVTSTGRYVVAWNLRDIAAGKLQPLIRRYGEQVTADNFKYGSDQHVVVALADDVQIVEKSNLKRARQIKRP